MANKEVLDENIGVFFSMMYREADSWKETLRENIRKQYEKKMDESEAIEKEYTDAKNFRV